MSEVVAYGRTDTLVRLRERALERAAPEHWEAVQVAFAVLEREVRRDG